MYSPLKPDTKSLNTQQTAINDNNTSGAASTTPTSRESLERAGNWSSEESRKKICNCVGHTVSGVLATAVVGFPVASAIGVGITSKSVASGITAGFGAVVLEGTVYCATTMSRRNDNGWLRSDKSYD